MEIIFLFVLHVMLGLWVGAIVFHSAVVAPATFKTLDAVSAAAFLRALFPRFFQFGIGCGAVSLLAFGAFSYFGGKTLPGLLAVLVSMLLIQIVTLAMVPGINRARDAGEQGRGRFRRLHAINVLLTLLVLGLGLLAIFRLSGL